MKYCLIATFLAMIAATTGCDNASLGGRIEPNQRSVTVSDSESHTVDGQWGRVRFGRPEGLAFDSQGNLYVADTKDHVIRIVSPEGNVRTFAGTPGRPGHADGRGHVARFAIPSGLAIDRHDNLYVADSANETIRKVSSDGVVTTYVGLDGKAGVADGDFHTATFDFPEVITVGPNEALYVIAEDSVRAVAADRSVSTLAGVARFPQPSRIASPLNAEARLARFNGPEGLAVDRDSNLYLADSGDMTIWKIDSRGWVRHFAGQFQQPGYVDGPRVSAQFYQPQALLLSSDGALFVADCHNATIRRIDTSGLVTTVAHVGCVAGIAMDRQGWLYASIGGIQPGSRRPGAILKISPNGVVSTFVGVEY